MAYLFLGDVSLSGPQISELKSKILITPEAVKLDYEVLYGKNLDNDELRKSLLSLPAVAQKRLIVIKECHHLNIRQKEIILQFLKEKQTHCVLVMESPLWDTENSYVKDVKDFVKVIRLEKTAELNAFALTKTISRRNSKESLKILSDLLSQGNHPLQIMGALVWSWGQARAEISTSQFQSGLRALREADLNIKRSRLKPEYALEVLVVKLCL